MDKKQKRKLLILAYIFLMGSMVPIFSQKNDWASLNLKGKVKEMKVYSCKEGKNWGKLKNDSIILKESVIFNADGNISSQTFYGKSGNLETKLESEYNDLGEKTSTTYYKIGNPTSIQTSKFIYDKFGKLQKKICYLFNGAIKETRNFYYDDFKNLVKEYVEEENPKKYYLILCTYDKSGNCTSRIDNDAKIVYFYDFLGQRILDSTFKFPGNKFFAVTSSKFNEQGDIVNSNFYNGGGSALNFAYKYVYDNQNNWVRKTMSYSPVGFEMRSIIYYDTK